MKKYVTVCFMILLLLVLTPEKVLASSYNEETVFDYADLMTPEEEEQLREIARGYEEQEISMIFLTTANAEGKSSMDYSDDFYDTNSFRPDGVLFFIDMDNREVYVNTEGTCITILTDYKIEKILDTGYDCVAEGEYFDGFEKMSTQAGNYIDNYDEAGARAEYFESKLRELQYFLAIRSREIRRSMVVALVITIIVYNVLRGKHKKANWKVPAGRYMGSSFQVNNKNVTYMGSRREVLRDYYKQEESSSSIDSGNSSYRSSGGSSRSYSHSSTHTSSRGVSHGGGGRKF